MLVTVRRPNSGEAPWMPMMLIRVVTNCYTSVKQGAQSDVLFWVRHHREAIWHESEARWLLIRTPFSTLPRVKVADATSLCGSDTRGELFGTRVRQGGFQSGRYLLHFRESRWQMRRVYVGLTPKERYMARE